MLVERLEGAFAADGIAEEHRDKIDDFIAPKAPPGKAHVLSDGLYWLLRISVQKIAIVRTIEHLHCLQM